MTAGDAYMEDETTCVVESEPETCQEFADIYCCFAGGEDGEDECRTDSLILAFVSKFVVIGSQFEPFPMTLQAITQPQTE